MKWLENIKGRLKAENIRNLSDKEIERCLCECVLSTELIVLAKKYRDMGLLN